MNKSLYGDQKASMDKTFHKRSLLTDFTDNKILSEKDIKTFSLVNAPPTKTMLHHLQSKGDILRGGGKILDNIS